MLYQRFVIEKNGGKKTSAQGAMLNRCTCPIGSILHELSNTILVFLQIEVGISRYIHFIFTYVFQARRFDGNLRKFYHPECLFNKFSPRSEADINGFGWLRNEDKDLIRQSISKIILF